MNASDVTTKRPKLRDLGGLKGLFRNPGLVLMTLRRGGAVGEDGAGNRFFETRKPRAGTRPRRWVVYARHEDASSVGPEWHGWLHYLGDRALTAAGSRPWQKPHQPNLTGTPAGYRPAGHDYLGGKRAQASADYESWSPDQ